MFGKCGFTWFYWNKTTGAEDIPDIPVWNWQEKHQTRGWCKKSVKPTEHWMRCRSQTCPKLYCKRRSRSMKVGTGTCLNVCICIWRFQKKWAAMQTTMGKISPSQEDWGSCLFWFFSKSLFHHLKSLFLPLSPLIAWQGFVGPLVLDSQKMPLDHVYYKQSMFAEFVPMDLNWIGFHYFVSLFFSFEWRFSPWHQEHHWFLSNTFLDSTIRAVHHILHHLHQWGKKHKVKASTLPNIHLQLILEV